jgi:hypothetical protein
LSEAAAPPSFLAVAMFLIVKSGFLGHVAVYCKKLILNRKTFFYFFVSFFIAHIFTARAIEAYKKLE